MGFVPDEEDPPYLWGDRDLACRCRPELPDSHLSDFCGASDCEHSVGTAKRFFTSRPSLDQAAQQGPRSSLSGGALAVRTGFWCYSIPPAEGFAMRHETKRPAPRALQKASVGGVFLGLGLLIVGMAPAATPGLSSSAGGKGTNGANQATASPSAGSAQAGPRSQPALSSRGITGASTPTAAAGGPQRFIVELSGPSAIDRANQRNASLMAQAVTGSDAEKAEAQTALSSASQTVRAEQALVISQAATLGARLATRTSVVGNFLMIDATPEAAAQLRQLPGVAAVTARRMLPRPDAWRRTSQGNGLPACSSVPVTDPGWLEERRMATSINALKAYHGFSGPLSRGLTGQGVTVAILDDGVDYTHEAFTGVANQAALDRAIAAQHSKDAASLASAGVFPSGPFVAGFDFYGAATDGPSSPQSFDANPLPYYGNFLDESGNPACIGMDSHGTHVADIIKSLAPDVKLAAYRVCGAAGCPDDSIIAALERAVDPFGDGSGRNMAQVINMSLGGDGTLGDALTKAADRAAALGVIVVSAAGNSGGDKVAEISTPAIAPKGIAVAQLMGPRKKGIMGAPAGSFTESTSSSGPGREADQIKPDIGAVGNVQSAVAGSLTGTDVFGGTSGATPVVSAAMALLRQQHPGVPAYKLRAKLVNTGNSIVMWGPSFPQNRPRPNSSRATVMSDLVSAYTTVSGENADWGLAPGVYDPELPNPLVVPNRNILVSARTPAPVYRVGGGRLRIDRALASPIAIYAVDAEGDARVPGDTEANHPASLRFGAFRAHVGGGMRPLATRKMVVENLTGTSKTLELSGIVNEAAKGTSGAVRITVPSRLNLAPWAKAVVDVRLEVDAARLKASRYLNRMGETGFDELDRADGCKAFDAVCAWLDTYDGYVVASVDGMNRIGVPWMASVYKASNPQVALSGTTLRLANPQGAQTATTEVFQWMGSSPYSQDLAARGLPQINEWGVREVEYVGPSIVYQGPNAPVLTVRVNRRAIEVAMVVRGGNVPNVRQLMMRFLPGVGIDVNGDNICGVSNFDTVNSPPGVDPDSGAEQLRKYWLRNSASAMGPRSPIQDAAMLFGLVGPETIRIVTNHLEQWFDGSSLTHWEIGLISGQTGLQLVRPRATGLRLSSTANGEYIAAGRTFEHLAPSGSSGTSNVPDAYTIVVRVPIDNSQPFKLSPPGRDMGTFVGGRTHELMGIRLRDGQSEVGVCPALYTEAQEGRIALPAQRFRIASWPRNRVVGVTSKQAAIATAPNAQQEFQILRNHNAPPNKGLLLLHTQAGQPYSTVALP